MTLGFVLSKMRQILLRLWAVDTAAQSAGRDADGFVRVTVRPIYSRNGIRVSAPPTDLRNRE